MKTISLGLALLLVMAVGVTRAQTAKYNWELGLGATFPRYENVNIEPLNSDYGADLSIQRNFSDHFALRAREGFSHLAGSWSGVSGSKTETTNLVSTDLDLMYYLIPHELVSPYLFAGMSGYLRMLHNNYTTSLERNEFQGGVNLGLGVEWKVAPQWSVVSEFGNHRTFNSELDGAVMSPAVEPNGEDTYWAFGIGVQFYFGKAEQPPPHAMAPAKDLTDYARIEDLIKEYTPTEITKEVVVEKYIKIPAATWYLYGVKFAFNRSELLEESYPVLNDAVKLLTVNADLNVQIRGYCDSIGTPIYNDTLSLQRAESVKAYLVSQGIASSRLSTIGYGLTFPIATNVTEEGRQVNRRVEFRVVSK
jgi:outer membrane protein OmpA-like peptidoglycan-associated protein